MSVVIHLLGRPHIDGPSGGGYQFRSRKSWALLAYLLLAERPAARTQLATLLFGEADDPLRALRWNLAELRRGLGDEATVEGDPVALRLPPGAVVDLDVLAWGSWSDAVQLPGLGRDLLDGLVVRDAPTFETWLLAQQRRVAAASEAILHEAALGSMSRGRTAEAIAFAVRAVTMNPLDENHHALLIRLYRLAGEHRAADRQYAACVATLDRELGTAPGSAVEAAMRERPPRGEPLADDASIDAVVEAGAAAVAAGAVEAGIGTVRTAVRLADGSGTTRLRVHARLVLAEALIHSLGGLDEEGLAMLFDADEIALAGGDLEAVARARAELGYVDFLRARYDRAELRLTEALQFADGSPSMVAKATTYLGSVASDRADYVRAAELLGLAVARSRTTAEPRREAYGLAMLGRLHLLRGDLEQAASVLDAAIAVTERDHWLAFLPWPQAMRGQVQLTMGDRAGAADLLRQAFARACQLGDPCWEGMAARGLALLAEAGGETARAFDVLADARARCRRHADPYVWLDGFILDAQCELGRRHDHPDTARWVDALRDLASRTGMRELVVRSLLHGAALGGAGDADAAALLAADIDNPALHALVHTAGVASPQYVRRT